MPKKRTFKSQRNYAKPHGDNVVTSMEMRADGERMEENDRWREERSGRLKRSKHLEGRDVLPAR